MQEKDRFPDKKVNCACGTCGRFIRLGESGLHIEADGFLEMSDHEMHVDSHNAVKLISAIVDQVYDAKGIKRHDLSRSDPQPDFSGTADSFSLSPD